MQNSGRGPHRLLRASGAVVDGDSQPGPPVPPKPFAPDIDSTQPLTLNIGYLRTLLHYLEQEHGIAPADLYGADMPGPPQQVDNQERTSLEDWHAAMAVAESHLDEPELALHLGRFVKPWHTSLMGFMLMTSGAIWEVGVLLGRFHHLLNNVYRVEATQSEQQFRLVLKPNTHITSQRLAKMSLISWADHARWLTGRANMVFDARFECEAPHDIAPYRQAFGGRVEFGQHETALYGALDYLLLPVIQQDPHVNAILRAQAIAQLERLTASSDGFLARLERMIKERMGAGRVTLDDLASGMSIAPRTLQIRLEEYGMTFRGLLDGVRKTQAKKLLADRQLSLIEIALSLGFANQTGFQHAFKRWTGLTPGEWRRQTSRRHPGN